MLSAKAFLHDQDPKRTSNFSEPDIRLKRNILIRPTCTKRIGTNPAKTSPKSSLAKTLRVSVHRFVFAGHPAKD
jgi:hypothetical protein